MIGLKDIQSTAADTIKASTFFSNLIVITDIGISRNEIESALTTTGFCVVVDMPLKGSVFQRAPGVSEIYTLLPFWININPEINGSTINALESVQELISAMLGFSSDDENDRFELEDDAFDLMISDAGLHSYLIMFRKLCSISE
jgi:hypothetical protein